MPPRGGNPTHTKPPSPPRPAPIIGAHGNVGASQPHGTAKLGPAPVIGSHGNVGASQPHGTAKLQRGGSDIQSSGANYGSGQASRFKQTKAYRQAVASVFKVQPTRQKAVILAGLMRSNAFNTPEGKAVKSALSGLSFGEQAALHDMLPHGLSFGEQAIHAIENLYQGHTGLSSPFGGTGQAAINQAESRIGSAAQKVPGVTSALHGIENLYAGQTSDLRSPFGGSGAAAVAQGAARLGAGIQSLPIPKPINQETQLSAAGLPPQQIVKNLGKDAVNLYAEAIPSVAIPAAQALAGHPAQGLNTAVGQPVSQFVHDPVGFIQHHPGYAVLMARGGVEGVARLAESAGRKAGGRPADLSQPSVHLTGNLTKERPNLSKYPITRRAQKDVAKQVYKPAGDGSKDVVPRNETVRSREIRKGVSSQVGVNERIRRINVQHQVQAHAKLVLSPRAARLAKAAKDTLKYNPKPGLIPGAEVLAHIAEGTLRRPDTYIRDLRQRLAKVSATRGDLLDFPKALAEHDQYVKVLKGEIAKAVASKNEPRRLQAVFAAAEEHAKAYAPLEAQAHAFGHYGKGVTKDMLERRVLTPIVVEHMPGARFDPALKTAVLDLQRGGSRVLSTDEMRAFAKRETGGRTLAYASHQAPKGDSAFYVNGQKFPSRAVQRNTMFAHSHGLVDPSHESLLQSRVHLQGVVDSHRAMGRLLGLLTEKNSEGGYWKSFDAAKRDAPAGYRPIAVGRIHGYDQPSPSDASTAAGLEEEALRHSVDINTRLQPSEATGNYALIHDAAADQLLKHANQISPNTFLRSFRGLTGQFRKVALGTSVKHIPGVVQENLIRDIASGVFIQHWFAERNVFRAAQKIDPQLAAERRIQQGGGQVAGATRALATRQVSRHFNGTALEGPLKGFEKLMRAPGPRQLSYAWNQWIHLAIDGTKTVLEEHHQRAAVGKQLMGEFGSLMRLQGEAARVAAEKGYLPDRAARKLRAGTERMYGKWTDMTPEAQTALMFSPFGMWWVNSAKWLARLPVDHPVKTAVLASAAAGTEKQRQALGLNLFDPNSLPLYMQGGISSGGKIVAQNYYSPFGVANDPLETAASLMEPTVTQAFFAAYGDNYLGQELKTPAHPHGGPTNVGTRARVILNSIFGTFIPFYVKAQTIAQGGASSYDTSTAFAPQTKTANPGLLPGLGKAVTPLRQYKVSKGTGKTGSAVVPGGGSLGGVVVPGHGSTDGVVIP